MLFGHMPSLLCRQTQFVLMKCCLFQGESISAARGLQLKAQDKGYKDFEQTTPGPNSFFHKLIQASYQSDGEQQHLTDLQIVPPAITFILAGYDTVSNALSFTLFELAKNHEAQAKVRAEIDAFFSSFGTFPDPSLLDHFPYTQACLLVSSLLLGTKHQAVYLFPLHHLLAITIESSLTLVSPSLWHPYSYSASCFCVRVFLLGWFHMVLET